MSLRQNLLEPTQKRQRQQAVSKKGALQNEGFFNAARGDAPSGEGFIITVDGVPLERGGGSTPRHE